MTAIILPASGPKRRAMLRRLMQVQFAPWGRASRVAFEWTLSKWTVRAKNPLLAR